MLYNNSKKYSCIIMIIELYTKIYIMLKMTDIFLVFSEPVKSQSTYFLEIIFQSLFIIIIIIACIKMIYNADYIHSYIYISL